MPANIDTDLLRAFVTVADRRSFTRAARSLHRTQAAVSMQIKRLEQITRTRLFDRGARLVSLTTEGERLLGYARRIVALNDEALQAMAETRFAGTVRLGVIEDYAAGVLPAILARFLAGHPQLTIEVETGLTTRLLQQLGRPFDLILAMHAAGTTTGEVVRRERPIWAVARGREVHEQVPLPLALSPQGCVFREWALATLDHAGRAWRITYVSPSLGAISAAVAAGLAISVFKASTCPPSLRLLGPRDGLPALPEADIVLHRAAGASRAVRALGDHLVEALRDATSPLAETTQREVASAS